jgi:guanosine-3',5'-bis(diphosphate) 3'-pyrophosphohydrolase
MAHKRPGKSGTRRGAAGAAGGDPALWARAASFSARAHRGQTRKDKLTPYAAHPARVAMTLASLAGVTDAEVLAAAFLHDTLEDTTTDYDDLAERFGERVARLVAALTKDGRLPEAEREEAYHAQLARAEPEARLIKLADVHDNLLDARESGDARRLEKTRGKARAALDLCSDDTLDATRALAGRVRALLTERARSRGR